ncbi:hypothetical protein AAHA92_18431 [Salvia divinorum]|uniref:Uncharacterized protein n=1 Tax=Salvia divinorum TaxID=28513 RepID=A0ABD1H231_SALDI
MSVGGRFCTSISTLMDTCEGGSHSHMEGTVKYSCHFGREDETLPRLCAPDDDPDKVCDKIAFVQSLAICGSLRLIQVVVSHMTTRTNRKIDNLRLELQPFVIDVIIVLPKANNL